VPHTSRTSDGSPSPFKLLPINECRPLTLNGTWAQISNQDQCLLFPRHQRVVHSKVLDNNVLTGRFRNLGANSNQLEFSTFWNILVLYYLQAGDLTEENPVSIRGFINQLTCDQPP